MQYTLVASYYILQRTAMYCVELSEFEAMKERQYKGNLQEQAQQNEAETSAFQQQNNALQEEVYQVFATALRVWGYRTCQLGKIRNWALLCQEEE